MVQLLLAASDIKLSYGLRTVLDIERFELYDGERVGLVGENGAGKTTFLRIISGELTPDSGTIRRFGPVSVIHQMDGEDIPDISDARVASEFDAQPERDGLSGGERTRRRIAGALSASGHILLADEPTSDLDTAGVERLEHHLKNYDGAIVLISHDRALLDALCDRIAELENGKLTIFPGNYSAYREEKMRQREFRQFEYDQYRGEQSRLRAAIQGKKEHASQLGKLPTRMGNSEARLHKRSATEVEEKVHKTRKALESRLAQLDVKERPREDLNIRMQLGAHSPITSRVAIEIRGMNMRFSQRILLENADMRLPTGSRTALIGRNGCGKTTLIHRIIKGNDPRIRINPGVKAGFFGQDHAEVLDLSKTALQNAMANSVYPESDVRTVLARLNMRGDDVFKQTQVLSGGERAKIALARLFVSDINLLILDEPTNHLDVFTMESLQQVLSGYGGTLLLVSHDRRFVEAVATRLVFFENTKLAAFEGDMAAWMAQQQKDSSGTKIQLDITTLEMRMAALVDRLSKPKKGDNPEALNAEYFELVEKWRALKAGVQA